MSKSPLLVKETPGTKYYCMCDKSGNSPYCDGAHQGTDCYPSKVDIDVAKTVAICNCKMSKTMPFCDGAHKSL